MDMSAEFRLPGSRWKCAGLLALTVLYVPAGIAHFVRPEFYLAIMPPYLPWPLALVYVSGVAEIAGGLGVLAIRTRRWAGLGLAALLLAVMPANIHMATHPEAYATLAPGWALYARLPIQLVLIGWALWATNPDVPSAPGR